MQSIPLLFDHCFSRWVPLAQYETLATLGFTIDSARVVEHEGGQFCRFLGIGDHYLEFVDIQDDATFFAANPDGTLPPFSTGLSLKTPTGTSLEELFPRISKTLVDFEPELEHKNYSWKENNTERLPGWNFLLFKVHPIKNLLLWCTEYEMSPGRASRTSIPKVHENTVSSVRGFVLNLDPSERAAVEAVTGSRFSNGELSLSDGIRLFDINERALPHLWKRKQTPFLGVVLGAHDPDRFRSVSGLKRTNELSTLLNDDCFIIPLHDRAFDLIVLGSSPFPPSHSSPNSDR